jgi:hypothetical protein
MTKDKTISVKPPGWHRQMERRKLITRMGILERAFAACQKIDRPQEWLCLQDELGVVYKEIMNLYGKN